MSFKIMVVEDDNLLNKSIAKILRSRGYEVFSAFSIKEAKLLFGKENPDIVLLDVMLPDGKGYDILPSFKNKSKVIIMTALSDKESKYLCYEKGAEDYIIKNFDMKELLYKIEVTKRNLEKDVLIIGDIILKVNEQELSCGDKSLIIPYSQVVLLKSLFKKYNENTFLPKEELLHFDDSDIDESARIQNLIARLRKNLNSIECERVYIETVYGFGYRLVIS